MIDRGPRFRFDNIYIRGGRARQFIPAHLYGQNWPIGSRRCLPQGPPGLCARVQPCRPLGSFSRARNLRRAAEPEDICQAPIKFPAPPRCGWI